MAPDVVHLGVDAGEGVVELAALDGRYVSAETAAAFTGRVVGMYAVAAAPSRSTRSATRGATAHRRRRRASSRCQEEPA